jgi:succinyl-diaminopimelate desuccinylase
MDVEKKVMGLVDREKEFMLRVLGELVSIPTVNPPGKSYSDMASYLERLLGGIGASVRVVEVPKRVLEERIPEYSDNPRYIVIAKIGSGRPVLHFNGHYDVVPAGRGWSSDPFKIRVEGDVVYGRGVVDMKGGIASSITALRVLSGLEARLRGSLEFSFTPDEETGGETGVLYMLEEKLVDPDYVVVPEASGSGNVWIGNKGALWLDVEVHGRQAHGSTPWLGANAFEGLVEIAGRIMRELKPRVESRKSKYDYGDPRAARPVMTVGGEVRGGVKINVVPGYFSFSIDRRLIPEENLDEAEREILDYISDASKSLEAKGLRVEVRVRSRFEATVTSPESRLVKVASAAIEKVVGLKPRVTVCPGGLDTRYFQVRGIDAITYGPGDAAYAHMVDERNSITELVNVAKAYSLLSVRILS